MVDTEPSREQLGTTGVEAAWVQGLVLLLREAGGLPPKFLPSRPHSGVTSSANVASTLGQVKKLSLPSFSDFPNFLSALLFYLGSQMSPAPLIHPKCLFRGIICIFLGTGTAC